MKLPDRRHALGVRGESDVCRIIASQGYRLLARNWKVKAGELDIVALDGEVVVFIEVKSRKIPSRAPLFDAASNLSHHQMKRNFAAAKLYRRVVRCTGLPGRFDLWEMEYNQKRQLVRALHHYDYLPPLPETPC